MKVLCQWVETQTQGWSKKPWNTALRSFVTLVLPFPKFELRNVYHSDLILLEDHRSYVEHKYVVEKDTKSRFGASSYQLCDATGAS